MPHGAWDKPYTMTNISRESNKMATRAKSQECIFFSYNDGNGVDDDDDDNDYVYDNDFEKHPS